MEFDQELTGSIKCTHSPGCVAESVACVATDASLTADPGVSYFRGD